MNLESSEHFFVQRFIDRRNYYSASAVAARFVAALGGDELEDFDTVQGSAFVVTHEGGMYFVTNRHVLDYNYKKPMAEVVPSATLKSVMIRGYSQPAEYSRLAFEWTYTHEGTSGITFHPDEMTDLAVISVQPHSFAPKDFFSDGAVNGLNLYESHWLASESEINSLTPGEQVFIVGYPGLAGPSERPVLVTGIVSSDPRYPAVFGNAKLGNAVLCHSFSWRGMSGAPVLGASAAIGKKKIIGINAGHVGGSGITGGVISHFVRSSALIEILTQFA